MRPPISTFELEAFFVDETGRLLSNAAEVTILTEEWRSGPQQEWRRVYVWRARGMCTATGFVKEMVVMHKGYPLFSQEVDAVMPVTEGERIDVGFQVGVDTSHPSTAYLGLDLGADLGTEGTMTLEASDLIGYAQRRAALRTVEDDVSDLKMENMELRSILVRERISRRASRISRKRSLQLMVANFILLGLSVGTLMTVNPPW